MAANEAFRKVEGILYNYPSIDKQIEAIKMHLKKLDDDIYDDGLSYGDKSSPTYKITSTVENHVIDREKKEIAEKVHKLNKEIENLKLDKQIIEMALTTLEDTEREFIKLRYFSSDKLKMNDIADRLCICSKSCSEVRKSAIKKMSKFITPTE